ncbi:MULTISPECIES: hypothetical protein [Citrobacter freundii complex]|uniref:Uncharacterized protein n=2 Tax=Citrobacter freundii complex TaxID=1344959 RepID=A0A9N8GW91_9ENTR|nr:MULTISPECIES: hypothetical protein [Citrobacter]MBC2622751.1 hypothetical protein [Citrobacter cronae]CAB5549072.1 Uncharacterised protein [Citrobacter werkmanii]CAB5577139.1 Uncharacterised protein [Citrobacter werkmanii]CAB5590866.1 Uncharacterised protein [Citrobacter werkmanii]CAB5592338.1 Uncharacterised protein [Citrobacter werkmanii]
MSDSRTGEAVYKEFIEFRDAFLTDAMDEASAWSTNKFGERFRPVVLVNARRLKKWTEAIDQWNKFAQELKKYPQLGIPVSLYEPAPKFISGAIRVRCYELPATEVTTKAREKILADYDREIERFKAIDNTNPYLKQLQEERKTFEALPPKTKLRLRRTGYTDLNCAYNTTEESQIMVRVSSSGVFFDERTLGQGFTFGPKTKNSKASIYSELSPIPQSLYQSIDIYDIDTVEKAKAARKKYREENEQEIKREQWSRYNKTRAAKNALQADAEHAASEKNPSGSSQD